MGGYKSKYSKTKDCGCGTKTYGSKTYGQKYCCNSVQAAPEPCCEPHETLCMTEICFRPTCTIIAVADETFELKFKNAADITPINANDMYFYHAAAGFMRIVGEDQGVYTVRLVDSAFAGAAISEDDCVSFHATSAGVFGGGSITARCLSGNFVAPAVNETETIYILNGSGIPIGATVTFTAEGETGSYIVRAYVSAANNIYAYEVENTGSGHTPGTQFSGDESTCNIPIEIITELDVCDAAEASNVDAISGCLGGSLRLFKPTGPGDVPYSADGNTWETTRISITECCVVTTTGVNFSGSPCPNNTDIVVLSATNITCFEDAWDAAVASNQNLSATIDGFRIIVVAYNSGNRQATIQPAADTTLPLTSFDAGAQICLGECCEACTTHHIQATDPNTLNQSSGPTFAYRQIVPGVPALISYPNGWSYWLVGFTGSTSLDSSLGASELDASYFANPDSVGPKLPTNGNRHIFKQVICNTSPNGCDQLVDLDFTYEISIDPVATGHTVDWEFVHYADANSLLPGGNPNPYGIANQTFTKSGASGRVIGPSNNRFADLQNSSFGFGPPGQGKAFPNFRGNFQDHIILVNCNCVLSFVWLFLAINSNTVGDTDLNVAMRIRRFMRKTSINQIALPAGAGNSEDWSV